MYDSDIKALDIRMPKDAEIGDSPCYDRSALKGYKCESFLKRAIEKHKLRVKEYLLQKYSIPENIKIRINLIEDGKKPIYEEFDVIELAKSKLVDLNSQECIRLYTLYQSRGLESLLNAIQHNSPIQKI